MSKDSYNFSGEFEYIGGQARPVTSKLEQELYDEDKNKPGVVIKVKRIATSKSENWKVLKNNELIFLIEGDKLNKKEKEYLRSVDGIRFMICQSKSGFKSMAAFKKSLKSEMKTKSVLTKKNK